MGSCCSSGICRPRGNAAAPYGRGRPGRWRRRTPASRTYWPTRTTAPGACLAHVLAHEDDRTRRWALRREAYRALADARTAIDLAAAELAALARHTRGTDEVAATLERLVDTTTLCAVHLDDSGRLSPRHRERLTGLLDELAERRAHAGLGAPQASRLPPAV